MALTDTKTALPHLSEGSGEPPMVLVHGFGGDQLAWAGLMPQLSPLRRTVAVELPGHGAAVGWPGPHKPSPMANAVLETIEALGAERAVLVGHSMGGAVASLAALKRPEAVERLILISPGGFGPKINARLLRRFAMMRDEVEIALVLEAFFAPTSPIPPELPQLIAEQRADDALAKSLAQIVDTLLDAEGQGVLPVDDVAKLPVPISLIWGEADAVVPVAQARAVPATIATHVLPDVGHFPHVEAVETVARIIAQAVAGRA